MRTSGCRHRIQNVGTRIELSTSLLVLALATAGCNNKPPHRQMSDPSEAPPTTQTAPPEPAPPPPLPETTPPTPTDTAPAATQPADPAPETLPASSYDSQPPYTVRLYLRSPEEEQPGWLKIIELTTEGSAATCTGEFPERNRIYVQTSNVRRLRLHISHLPLAANQRTILRIDNQGIELARRDRRYIFFERLTTGEWVVTHSE